MQSTTDCPDPFDAGGGDEGDGAGEAVATTALESRGWLRQPAITASDAATNINIVT